MFYPKLFNDDIFDDFFDFPRFRMPAEAEHKLYGKHAAGLMKTDIRDKDGNYELDIDLPGFKKDEIALTLDNGYLVVGACKMLNEEEKDDKCSVRNVIQAQCREASMLAKASTRTM